MPCKHPSWNWCGIDVSQSCWDHVVKRVKMSSFLDGGISNITNLCYARNLTSRQHKSNMTKITFAWVTNNIITPQICYVRNTDVEKTRHFNIFHHVILTWPTNINTTSAPRRVLAGWSRALLQFTKHLTKVSKSSMWDISLFIVLASYLASILNGMTLLLCAQFFIKKIWFQGSWISGCQLKKI